MASIEKMRSQPAYAESQIRVLLSDLKNSSHSVKMKAVKRFQEYVEKYKPEPYDDDVDYLYTGALDGIPGPGLLYWAGLDSAKHGSQLKRIAGPVICLIKWLITLESDDWCNIFYERFIVLPMSELVKINFSKHIAHDGESGSLASWSGQSRLGACEEALEILSILMSDYRREEEVEGEDEGLDLNRLLNNNKACKEKFTQYFQRSNADQIIKKVAREGERKKGDYREMRATTWASLVFKPVPLQEGEEGEAEEVVVEEDPRVPDPLGISDLDLRATQQLHSSGRLSNRNRSNSTASQAGRGRKGSVLGSLEKVQKLHEDASGSQEGNAGTVTKRLIHIDDDDEDEEEDSGDEDGFGTHRGIGGHKHGKGGMKALGGRGAISNKDGGPEVIESLLPFEKNFSPSFFLTLIHGSIPFSALLTGWKNLKHQLAKRTDERESLVRTHFGLFIHCTEGLEWLKAYRLGLVRDREEAASSSSGGGGNGASNTQGRGAGGDAGRGQGRGGRGGRGGATGTGAGTTSNAGRGVLGEILNQRQQAKGPGRGGAQGGAAKPAEKGGRKRKGSISDRPDDPGEARLRRAQASLDKAKQEATMTLAPILDRMKRSRKIKNADAFLRRLTHTLDLPHKMRVGLEEGNWEDVCVIYGRVLALTGSTTSNLRILKRVRESASAVINDLQNKCIAAIRSPHTHFPTLLRFLLLLRQLQGDTSYFDHLRECFTSQLGHFCNEMDEIQKGFIERGRLAIKRGMELNEQQADGMEGLSSMPLDHNGALSPDDGDAEEEDDDIGTGVEDAINAALSRYMFELFNDEEEAPTPEIDDYDEDEEEGLSKAKRQLGNVDDDDNNEGGDVAVGNSSKLQSMTFMHLQSVLAEARVQHLQMMVDAIVKWLPVLFSLVSKIQQSSTILLQANHTPTQALTPPPAEKGNQAKHSGNVNASSGTGTGRGGASGGGANRRASMRTGAVSSVRQLTAVLTSLSEMVRQALHGYTVKPLTFEFIEGGKEGRKGMKDEGGEEGGGRNAKDDEDRVVISRFQFSLNGNPLAICVDEVSELYQIAESILTGEEGEGIEGSVSKSNGGEVQLLSPLSPYYDALSFLRAVSREGEVKLARKTLEILAEGCADMWEEYGESSEGGMAQAWMMEGSRGGNRTLESGSGAIQTGRGGGYSKEAYQSGLNSSSNVGATSVGAGLTRGFESELSSSKLPSCLLRVRQLTLRLLGLTSDSAVEGANREGTVRKINRIPLSLKDKIGVRSSGIVDSLPMRFETAALAFEDTAFRGLRLLASRLRRPYWVTQTVLDGVQYLFSCFIDSLKSHLVLRALKNEDHTQHKHAHSQTQKGHSPLSPKKKKKSVGGLEELLKLEMELKESESAHTSFDISLLDLIRACVVLRSHTLVAVWQEAATLFACLDGQGLDNSSSSGSSNPSHSTAGWNALHKLFGSVPASSSSSSSSSFPSTFPSIANAASQGIGANILGSWSADEEVLVGRLWDSWGKMAAMSRKLSPSEGSAATQQAMLNGELSTLREIITLEVQSVHLYINHKVGNLKRTLLSGMALLAQQERANKWPFTPSSPPSSHASRILLMLRGEMEILKDVLVGATIEKIEEDHSSIRSAMGVVGSAGEATGISSAVANSSIFTEDHVGAQYSAYIFGEICRGLMGAYANVISSLSNNTFSTPTSSSNGPTPPPPPGSTLLPRCLQLAKEEEEMIRRSYISTEKHKHRTKDKTQKKGSVQRS